MWLFVSGGEIGSSEELLSGGSLIVYPAEGWACTDWITGLKAIRNIRGNTPLFTGKEGGCQALVATCAESEEYRFWTYGVGRLVYSRLLCMDDFVE